MSERREHPPQTPEVKTAQQAQLLLDSADAFVAGSILIGKERVHEGDKSVIYRCIEIDAGEVGVEGARFRLDYRKYHEVQEKQFDQLRFEYTRENEQEQVPFAEMHLGIVDDTTFVLQHRYVSPDLRSGRGVGSQLLHRTEEWVQRVADDRNEPVRIVLQAGQESVFRWLEKMGFSVQEDQKDVLDELRSHPERFTQDSVILSEESSQAGVVKDPYIFRKEDEGRYMEDAIRLTFEKKFEPTPVSDTSV